MYKDQKEVIESRKDVNQIIKALYRFPNLERIEFGPEPYLHTMRQDEVQRVGFELWDEEPTINVEPDITEVFAEAKRFWEVITGALRECKCRLREFSIRRDVFLESRFEAGELWSSKPILDLFSHLHSVDLEIPYVDGTADTDNLSRLRRVITALNHTRIGISSPSPILDVLIGGKAWPRLSTLKLSLPFHEDTLHTLVVNHKSLPCLSIRSSKLTHGFWPELFRRLRKHEEFKVEENRRLHEALQPEEYASLASVDFHLLRDSSGLWITPELHPCKLTAAERYVISGGEDPTTSGQCRSVSRLSA